MEKSCKQEDGKNDNVEMALFDSFVKRTMVIHEEKICNGVPADLIHGVAL
jgi:hypothetical protein